MVIRLPLNRAGLFMLRLVQSRPCWRGLIGSVFVTSELCATKETHTTVHSLHQEPGPDLKTLIRYGTKSWYFGPPQSRNAR